MSRDWSWWDAWRSGDPDASQRALEAEADQSLERDSSRWSWRSTEEAGDRYQHGERRSGGRGGHVADQRHRSGKGHVESGESGERTQAFDYDGAKADYQRQNPRSWWDGESDDDHDQGRGWFR